MFLVNGKFILVYGKPFLSHIPCGFLNYAWCIFKSTEVTVYIRIMYKNNLPNVKTYDNTITLK